MFISHFIYIHITYFLFVYHIVLNISHVINIFNAIDIYELMCVCVKTKYIYIDR